MFEPEPKYEWICVECVFDTTLQKKIKEFEQLHRCDCCGKIRNVKPIYEIADDLEAELNKYFTYEGLDWDEYDFSGEKPVPIPSGEEIEDVICNNFVYEYSVGRAIRIILENKHKKLIEIEAMRNKVIEPNPFSFDATYFGPHYPDQ